MLAEASCVLSTGQEQGWGRWDRGSQYPLVQLSPRTAGCWRLPALSGIRSCTIDIPTRGSLKHCALVSSLSPLPPPLSRLADALPPASASSVKYTEKRAMRVISAFSHPFFCQVVTQTTTRTPVIIFVDMPPCHHITQIAVSLLPPTCSFFFVCFSFVCQDLAALGRRRMHCVPSGLLICGCYPSSVARWRGYRTRFKRSRCLLWTTSTVRLACYLWKK